MYDKHKLYFVATLTVLVWAHTKNAFYHRNNHLHINYYTRAFLLSRRSAQLYLLNNLII